MLEPAGLINLSKIYKEAKRQLQEARAKKAAAAPKKIYRPEIEDSRPITSKPAVNPEIGRINSLATASLNISPVPIPS
jgi:SpoVK/Ycf46/Vps4 family AAA+-type ATPase